MTTNSPDAGVDVISREAALDAVPTNWLDNLLTGPDAVLRKIGNYDCPDIERLLNAIRNRIKAIPTSPPSREETIEAARQKIIDAAMKWHGANIDYPVAIVALADAVKEYRALHK